MTNLKFKRALFACALIAELAGISSTSAQAVVVDGSSGGSGGSTGVNLTVGQIFPPPGRQSLFATDADESLQPLGTLIRDIFQLWTQILNRHQYYQY